MNNTEPFDNWIRDEINGLESTPKEFDSAALWQKIQPELRVKKPLSGIRFSLLQRFAAAALLLMVSALGWWRYSVLPSELAVVKIPVRTKTSAKPADIAFNTNKTRTQFPKTKVIKRLLIPQKTTQPIEQKVINSVEMAVSIPKMVQPASFSNVDSVLSTKVATIKPRKPKFKVVHANELADYQRTELAETRAKEAEKQGFIIINWKNKETTSANNLRTFLRNKKEQSQ